MTERILKAINYLPNETYRCDKENLKLNKGDINKTWKCPTCDSYVHIYSKDDEGNEGTFIRKQADEIEVGDLVRPNTFGIDECHEVLDVSIATGKKNKGKIRVALKGYTVEFYNPNDGIACRV